MNGFIAEQKYKIKKKNYKLQSEKRRSKLKWEMNHVKSWPDTIIYWVWSIWTGFCIKHK